jgi:hypothetical protein
VARDELGSQSHGSLRILEVDEAVVRACTCRHLVRWERSGPEPGRDLLTNLQLIFELRR